MKKCAFLTIENTDGWFIDDDLVHEPLKKLGWSIENIAWKSNVDWNQFDIVVMRSTWDYQNDIPRFLDTLEAIESSSAALFNSLETVKWNIDKGYLLELHNQGVPIVPTVKFDHLTEGQIHNALKDLSKDEIIVKPMVGANADDTYRVSRAAAQEKIPEILNVFQAKSGFLQPFMKSVVEEGEYSVIYINGQISHVILKTVGKGDFRVQEEHGGGVVPVADPDEQLFTTARQVMEHVPFETMYARVDLVRTSDSNFALMELELIEPALYFRFDENSADRFAEAIEGHYALRPQSM